MLIIDPGVFVCYNDGDSGVIIRRIYNVPMLYEIMNFATNKVEQVSEHHIDKIKVYETDESFNWMEYDILKDKIPYIDVNTRLSFAFYEDLKRSKNNCLRDNRVKRKSGRYPWGDKATHGYIYSFKPKQVIFNGPATIVLWRDGTKTIVKRREGEEDDREKAIMYCILKKLCGNKAEMDKYLKLFLKEDSNNEEKA